MDWRMSLSPEVQQHITALEGYGCQFCWRENFSGFAYIHPKIAGEHIFEIWRSGRLLDYLAPVSHPFEPVGIMGIELFLTHQWDVHRKLLRPS